MTAVKKMLTFVHKWHLCSSQIRCMLSLAGWQASCRWEASECLTQWVEGKADMTLVEGKLAVFITFSTHKAFDLAIPRLYIHPVDRLAHALKDNASRTFAGALFIVIKPWKQPASEKWVFNYGRMGSRLEICEGLPGVLARRELHNTLLSEKEGGQRTTQVICIPLIWKHLWGDQIEQGMSRRRDQLEGISVVWVPDEGGSSPGTVKQLS